MAPPGPAPAADAGSRPGAAEAPEGPEGSDVPPVGTGGGGALHEGLGEDAVQRDPVDAVAELSLPEVAADAVHRDAVVVDLHVDTLWQMRSKRRAMNHRGLEASPSRLVEGGVDVQFYSVWVPPDDPHPRSTAMELIDLFEKTIVAPDGPRVLAGSAAQAVELVGQGKAVALLGLEGAVALEGDAAAVDLFHARGVRYVALTWNEANPFGAGAAQLTGGATPRGLDLVRRLNDKRIVVDVSHANPETFWDVVTRSERPVIASHSNAWAVHAHRRNLNDVQLFALRESGGVVGLNFHARFVGGKGATLADVLDHAQHLRTVGGPGFVALGTDFDGQIRTPRGLEHIGRLPQLSDALAGAGWTPPEVTGLLGHSFLRTMHRVETGVALRRVTHRPAAFSDVASTATGTQPGLAFDSVVTTGWRPPPGEPTGHVLSATVIGPDVDQVAICGSTVTQASGVRLVEVRVRDEAGKMLSTAQLALTPDVRPHRVALPESGRAGLIHVDVEVVEVEGVALVAEIVFERRVR